MNFSEPIVDIPRVDGDIPCCAGLSGRVRVQAVIIIDAMKMHAAVARATRIPRGADWVSRADGIPVAPTPTRASVPRKPNGWPAVATEGCGRTVFDELPVWVSNSIPLSVPVGDVGRGDVGGGDVGGAVATCTTR